MSAKNIMFVLNTLCDLICNVYSCCVWSWDTSKINVYDNITIKNKKTKYGNKRNFYVNLHLADELRMEFTAC